MKTPALLLASALFLAAALHAETTPLTDPVPDATETEIACELTQAPPFSQVPVFTSQKESETAKGTYHYKLWLPQGYAADAQKRWPCMFIMSAGGNAEMGNMAGSLKSRSFIVVMLTDAKNGEWAPIVGNFLTAHDDVTKRVRVDETKKYATGQSGGARGSSVFVQLRPGFCGLIMQSAGASSSEITNNYNVNGLKRNARLYIAMTMGASDSNKTEVARMAQLLSPAHFTSFEFNGGHEWAPADVFEKAMAWLDSKTSKTTGGTATGGSFDDFFKKQ